MTEAWSAGTAGEGFASGERLGAVNPAAGRRPVCRGATAREGRSTGAAAVPARKESLNWAEAGDAASRDSRRSGILMRIY
jgi:hypothetical protein